MTAKKDYKVNDEVWIHVGSSGKLAKGRVIKVVDLSDAGWANSLHYIIEVPTHIDPLLEIRSWHAISQDEHGPVGCFRGIGDMVATIKKAKTTGFVYSETPEDNEPSAEQILAALEKSQQGSVHQPLVLKDTSRKPRNYRKKKQ